MDLNNTEIYIEWETPKDKNGNEATKGVSEVYIRDIESEPGKLIFGWAISESITKSSGTLKFSVRFVQWNDEKKKIQYSYNTLTAQVTIHPTLNFDLASGDYKFENSNDRLLDRIQESEVVGGVQAAIPYYLENIELLPDGYDIEDNHTDGTYKLYVVATAADTGAISYTWKRADLNANNVSDDVWVDVQEDATLEMVPVDLEACDFKLAEGHVYHIKNEDDTFKLYKGSYDLRSAYPTLTDGDIIDLGFHEQKSCLVVEKYGQYKAEAKNRIFNSLTKKYSNIATFKRPDAVELDNSAQTVDKHIIDTESAKLAPVIKPAIGDMAYQWFKAPEGKKINEIVELTKSPAGTQITYGDDYVRICAPNSQEAYELQNVGEGGNASTYYGDVRFYYPEGAVKFKEIWWNPSKAEPDINTYPYDMIVDEHPGVDAMGRKYILDWLSLASYSASTKIWTPYGWNKPFGEFAKSFQKIQWFDESDNLLREDYIEYQYASGETFEAFGNFEPVVGAVAEELVASEPGIYKLEATRTRNRDSVSAQSIEYRVTHAPAVPAFDENTFNAQTDVYLHDLASHKETLTIGFDPSLVSDEIFVTWKHVREQGDLVITQQKLHGVYTTSMNPVDYADVFEAAGIDMDGLYYAIATNKLNGVVSEATAVPAAKFNVIDIND